MVMGMIQSREKEWCSGEKEDILEAVPLHKRERWAPHARGGSALCAGHRQLILSQEGQSTGTSAHRWAQVMTSLCKFSCGFFIFLSVVEIQVIG